MGALIEDRLQQPADLEPGGRDEFTVWVDGNVVAEKTRTGFPAEPAVLEAVRRALD